MMKFRILIIGLILLLSMTVINAEDAKEIQPLDSSVTIVADSTKNQKSDQIVAYYLHMNRRCMTCGKLEAYSQEAITAGFAEQLKDSTIVWRVENFEQEGNEHFAKDYKLYSQSLILSRVRNGKEVEWKSLDQIWNLVRDKEKFIVYVQTEIQKFMNPVEEK